MPRIPVLDTPRVQSAPLPNVRFGVDTRGSYGEAVTDGLQQVAGGLDHLSDAARKQKEQMDDARVMDAYAKISEWQNQNVYHPEKGALAVRGEKAIGLGDRAISEFDKFSQSVSEALADDGQRDRFSKILQRERETTYRTLTRHEAGQVEAVKEEKYSAAIDASVSKAANAALADPESARTEQSMGEGAVVLRGNHMGWSGEQVQAELSKYRTRLHLSVLDRMLDGGRADLAQAYLKEHGAEIDGKARGDSSVDHRLQSEVVAAQVDSAARDILRKSVVDGAEWVDPAKALAAVDALPGGAAKKAISDLVDEGVQKGLALKKRAGDDRLNEIIAVHEKTGSVNDPIIRRNREWLLDPKNGSADLWQSFERGLRAERRSAKTSTADERRLQAQLNAEAFSDFLALPPEEQLAVDVNGAPQYSDADVTTRNRMRQRQQALRNTTQKGSIVRESEAYKAVDAKAVEAKLNKDQSKLLKSYMTRWREQWLSEHDGKEPPRTDFTKALGEALLYGDKQGGSILSPNRFKFQVPEGERFQPFPSDEQPVTKDVQPTAQTTSPPPATKSDEDRARDALIKAGKTPTPEMIQRTLQRARERKGTP